MMMAVPNMVLLDGAARLVGLVGILMGSFHVCFFVPLLASIQKQIATRTHIIFQKREHVFSFLAHGLTSLPVGSLK